MSQNLPPARPNHMPERPEFPRSSRYQRPRRYISWWGLVIGAMIGLAGGLSYAWVLNPIVETDTTPAQLNRTSKSHWVVAIALSFAENSDLGLAIKRLTSLNLGVDPITEAANIACDLARSGYVDSDAGLRAVRSLKTFYQLQGRKSCADTLIPEVQDQPVVEIAVPTATPTLPPPPSKTPTVSAKEATATPEGIVIVPTNIPRRVYDATVQTFCDTEKSGLIEVYVRTFDGQAIAGEAVRVRWDGGQDRFVTGLKPEFGRDYADFEMQDGFSYIVDMPGLSDPIDTPLNASRCVSENGSEAITSYRVYFRQIR